MSLSFNFIKFKEFIVKRNTHHTSDNTNILSTIIKNCRLDQNMTLEDLTKDICSKAYLCKFENNLIDIDKNIARSLCERVNVDYDQVKSITMQSSIKEAISFYLFNQEEELVHLFNIIETEHLFIVNNELIKVLYYLSINDLVSSSNILDNLEKVKTTFSDIELGTFIVCVLLYYYKNNEFRKASDFIEVIGKVGFALDELRQLYKEAVFIVYANLNNLVLAYQAYNNLMLEQENMYPLKRQFANKVLFIETFPSSDAIKELEQLRCDYLPKEYEEDFWYSYCIVLLKRKDYVGCLDKILELDLKNARFAAIYAYAVSRHTMHKINIMGLNPKDLNKLDYIEKDYIKGFNYFINELNIEHKKSLHRTFVKLVSLELTCKNDEDVIDYLRSVCMKEDALYQHRLYSFYYASLLLRLYGNIAHYKDAYTLAIQNKNLLGEVKNGRI